MDARLAETRVEWLKNALGELTPKQRFVVELRHGLRDGHEYKFAEIARLMGVSRHAAQRIYRRGLKRLNHQGGLHLRFICREVNRPPANAGDDSLYDMMGCEPPVCLSPLIPSAYGLTHDETVQVLKELFGG